MRKPNEYAAGSSYEQRAPLGEYLDVSEKYVVEFCGMDEETGRFKDKDTGEPTTSIIWKFWVWHKESGEPVLATDGNPYEMIRFTPDGTWRDEKTGKVSLTRQFIEALVGRVVSDAEVESAIDRGISTVLMRKRAIADLEEAFKWDSAGNEIIRYKITRLVPLRASMAGAVNPQRRAAELARPAAPAQRPAQPAHTPLPPRQLAPVAPVRTLRDDPEDGLEELPF